jgi:hypothetical protein
MWRRVYARFGAHLGFGSAALVLLIGWLGRDTHDLSAKAGLGYALGIAGLTCMLALLIYPLRKRLRFLAFLGATKSWFRTHMILGTVGPLAALYHCNFKLGSVNDRVALFSALLVASSGFVGRYIYSKIHHGLYGRRASLKDLLARVEVAGPTAARVASFVPELTTRLVEFDRGVLVSPSGLLASIRLALRIAVITRWQHWKLMRFTRRKLLVESMYSPLVSRHRRRFEEITNGYVAMHMREVRRVAQFIAYQQLFALWHVVHRPFFLILLVSVAIHVFAVHYY